MSEHCASLTWTRQSHDFLYQNYNREHRWSFEGGQTIMASAAPEYLGKKEFVNPEEAFIASIASCHMLTFLAVASKKGLIVESYSDKASGILEKGENNKFYMTRITLKPDIVFKASSLDKAVVDHMHELAHASCFIANSIITDVTVSGSYSCKP